MITGPRMSRKDLVLSEIWGSEDIVGRPSSVLFLSQARAIDGRRAVRAARLRTRRAGEAVGEAENEADTFIEKHEHGILLFQEGEIWGRQINLGKQS